VARDSQEDIIFSHNKKDVYLKQMAFSLNKIFDKWEILERRSAIPKESDEEKNLDL